MDVWLRTFLNFWHRWRFLQQLYADRFCFSSDCSVSITSPNKTTKHSSFDLNACEFYDGKTDSLSLFKDFFCGFSSVNNTSEMEGSRSTNPCQAPFFSFDISFLLILHAPDTPCSYLNNNTHFENYFFGFKQTLSCFYGRWETRCFVEAVALFTMYEPNAQRPASLSKCNLQILF